MGVAECGNEWHKFDGYPTHSESRGTEPKQNSDYVRFATPSRISHTERSLSVAPGVPSLTRSGLLSLSES